MHFVEDVYGVLLRSKQINSLMPLHQAAELRRKYHILSIIDTVRMNYYA
jgi:hypothetical protein